MSSNRIFSAAIAAVLLASPLAAQRVTDAPQAALLTPSAMQAAVVVAPAPAAVPAAATSLASTQSDAAVGVRAITMATPFAPAPAPRAYGRSPALMIVGGVMLLTGAVIGGDSGTIVMLGGAGIGLFGLWNYLR
jgi:hypothetical protein